MIWGQEYDLGTSIESLGARLHVTVYSNTHSSVCLSETEELYHHA